jgi:hypothetical protein
MVPKAPLVTSSSDTIPSSDMTTIDFNRTLNPPCAFTSYIACSLPPKCNYLPLRIEAGERRYVTTMAQKEPDVHAPTPLTASPTSTSAV